MQIIRDNLITLARAGCFDIVLHGANCFHQMGAGIAKSLADAFPPLRQADLATSFADANKVGSFSVVNLRDDSGRYFLGVNAYTEFDYRPVNGRPPFQIEALKTVLRDFARSHPGASYGLPLIGCGLGGGNQQEVRTLLESFSTYIESRGGSVTLAIYTPRDRTLQPDLFNPLSPKVQEDQIRVIGPRELSTLGGDHHLVDTTSKSREFSDLSPFKLANIDLYDGRKALKMENAWQFSKVYPQHLDGNGEPGKDYWSWAQDGWNNPSASRYPMGKGAKPAFSYWDGEKLGYLDARKNIYFPMYQNAVVKTEGFAKLQEMVSAGRKITLFDFDGYDHQNQGLRLDQVLNNPSRPMGHAFVLKAMLTYGRDISPQKLESLFVKTPETKLILSRALSKKVDIGR